MKLLPLVVGLLLPATAIAGSVTIDFDKLQTGSSYIEDGYLFSGNFSRDTNFSSSPSLRFYGNSALTVSRIDGGNFTLDALTILYRHIDGGWFMENESRSGFTFSRAGEYATGQFLASLTTNVRQLRIFDPAYDSGNYYVFDRFQLSSVDAIISEPSTLSAILAAVAIGLGLRTLPICSRDRMKAHRHSDN